MNKRPLSITIISWILIAVGCIALLNGFLMTLVDQSAAQRIGERKAQPLLELGLVSGVRILAVISGVFMLFGFNWATQIEIAHSFRFNYVGSGRRSENHYRLERPTIWIRRRKSTYPLRSRRK